MNVDGMYISTGENFKVIPPKRRMTIKTKSGVIGMEEWDVNEILKEIEEMEREEEERRKKMENAIKKGIVDGVIVDIKKGIYKDFLDEDLIKRLDIDPSAEAVQVRAVNEKYGIVVVETMKKSVHEKAKFRKLVKQYIKGGEMDEHGRFKVKLVYDKDKERWKIFLP